MPVANTALLLIGFQNDYFSPEGILHSVFENPDDVVSVVNNTSHLLKALAGLDSNIAVIETPIQFTEDFQELEDPIGILKIIKDHGAFKKDSFGCATIEQIADAPISITSMPGKRGLNCFSNTNLHALLEELGVNNVVIAGAVTSLCIDTAGREAMDLGYKVTILDDCILSRTAFEQQYYLEEIMPLYCQLTSSGQFIESLGK